MGQKLGEFIDPSVYELEVSVSKTIMPALSVGEKVTVRDTESFNMEWLGSIIRINAMVDPMTQTVQVFIQVRGENLREGMYLEALMKGEDKENAFEISRKLLVDGTKVYLVRDNILDLIPVEPVYFTEKTAIIRGLSDGDLAVTNIVPGAYSGMKVKVFEGE
jgi:multidrug efflux pump subunit AcrA (membrane-fusion protein)